MAFCSFIRNLVTGAFAAVISVQMFTPKRAGSFGQIQEEDAMPSKRRSVLTHVCGGLHTPRYWFRLGRPGQGWAAWAGFP